MAQLDELKLILARAMGEPIGLLLASSDPERARAKLYAARREAQDPSLAILQIRMGWDPGTLILVKRQIKLEGQANAAG